MNLRPLAYALGLEFQYRWHLAGCAICRSFRVSRREWHTTACIALRLPGGSSTR